MLNLSSSEGWTISTERDVLTCRQDGVARGCVRSSGRWSVTLKIGAIMTDRLDGWTKQLFLLVSHESSCKCAVVVVVVRMKWEPRLSEGRAQSFNARFYWRQNGWVVIEFVKQTSHLTARRQPFTRLVKRPIPLPQNTTSRCYCWPLKRGISAQSL